MSKKDPKCCYNKCKNRISRIIILTEKNKCLKCESIFCNKHRLPETHKCIKKNLSEEEKEQNIITAIEELSVNPNKRKIDKI